MTTTRHCGDCQLCCKLVPVKELQKPAGQRCRFQKFGKGCTVYQQRQMPAACQLWNCRWLVNDDCDEISRPDRAHFVIDIMPDFITVDPHDGRIGHIQVAQVWVDPHHRDAHRDPALRRWMLRRAEEGIATIVRFNEREAFVIFAPPFDKNGQWHEIASDNEGGPSHTIAEIEAALGRITMEVTP